MRPAEARAAFPDFPWLEANDPAGVARLMQSRGWLAKDERLLRCRRAGEGNMNLTLRVHTDRRSVILKQARPWVEKYDSIDAPWNRMLLEQRFYRRVRNIAEVAERMPRLLAADAEARCILLEDLAGAADLTDCYSAGRIGEPEIEALARYLAALHAATLGPVDPQFLNLEMRQLNHEHIYRLPLSKNGLELDRFESGLRARADELRGDRALADAVKATGMRYLGEGRCLVHGDFFPGSWLRSQRGIMVIDAEFCYWGDPEFDLGCALAHFALSRQDKTLGQRFLRCHAAHAQALEIDDALVARYAACEVIRRLIGVAQLPMPPSSGLRRELLTRSREAIKNERVERLWA